MKKHLSVLTLAARGTIDKALLLLLAMTGLETAAFYCSMSHVLSQELPTLEAALTQSQIHWIAVAVFLILTPLLMIHTASASSKTGYTLGRLSVSERGFVLWQTVWHMICYAFFWAVQLLLVFAFCLWYSHSAPTELVSSQSMFLAFHRVTFLFNLMPMGYTIRWVRNVLFLMSISFTAACFSYHSRRSKVSLVAALQTGLITFFSRTTMTDSSADTLAIVLTCGVLLIAAWNLMGKEEEPDEKTIS